MNPEASTRLKLIAGVTASIAFFLYVRRISSQSKKSSSIQSLDFNDSKDDDASTLDLAVIDLSLSATNDIDYLDKCKGIAKALHENGVVIIRDNRVSATDNDAFIDMMERYYAGSDGIRDARPEYHYQVGVTPSRVERPRDHTSQIQSLGLSDKPLSPLIPEYDAKWRFFWRMGKVPVETKFPLLNMDAVVPPEIPEWSTVMDAWGNKMLDALNTASEMAATGFGLPPDAFTSRLSCGPHLLAPTGSDYSVFSKEGTVLAGYHYDLNFLTIHGKSRYPGLYIWTRKGRKVAVAVPEGCLLVQAGKQLEHLTGGHVIAGYHEVVVSPATTRVILARKACGLSLWRISSTLFGHIQSDQILEPLEHFRDPATKWKFPPILAGDQVREELLAIALDKSNLQCEVER